MKWHYTCKKGEIAPDRKHTYKSPQAYERAFYKFVCKQGWYSNMKDGVRPPIPNLNGAGGMWERGYPSFRSWRSEAYRQFNQAAEERLEHAFLHIRLELQRIEDEDRRWREEKERAEREEMRRLVDAELKTGWFWWTAARELGFDYVENARGLPLVLIEAKQFQMGLTTLINATRKARKNQKQSYDKRSRTP